MVTSWSSRWATRAFPSRAQRSRPASRPFRPNRPGVGPTRVPTPEPSLSAASGPCSGRPNPPQDQATLTFAHPKRHEWWPRPQEPSTHTTGKNDSRCVAATNLHREQHAKAHPGSSQRSARASMKTTPGRPGNATRDPINLTTVKSWRSRQNARTNDFWRRSRWECHAAHVNATTPRNRSHRLRQPRSGAIQANRLRR
jgi:hypothetical protein